MNPKVSALVCLILTAYCRLPAGNLDAVFTGTAYWLEEEQTAITANPDAEPRDAGDFPCKMRRQPDEFSV